MSLAPGTRLGPYEVLAAIGAGAEERYKASDTRRNRVVSVKVLPQEFSENPEMKERLERDARTISSLNHPQICALVDVGHQDPATDFLVSEYIEGETLSERLARSRDRALPGIGRAGVSTSAIELDEALAIAIQIADALDKAHREGVTHGGLNPSTVVLTASGPRLLDFGVAKLKDESHPGVSASVVTRTSIPTMSAAPSVAAPYMAPEQFAGGQVDARTDIFAFGTILYEMVTGRPAFHERTLALLIAAVQSVDPDPVSKAQPMAPPALDHVIRRCLSKDPRQRLQTAWDLLIQLQWIAEGGSQVGLPAPVAARRQRRDWAIWAGVGAASLLATGLTPAAVSSFRASIEPELVRFTVSNMGAGAVPLSISPDGRWITNSRGAPNRGVDALLFGSVIPQVLVEDNVMYQPFWSPDSRSIAFFEDGKLKKADISGGPAQTVSDAPVPVGGGTWNSDGVILFSSAGLIYRVLAAGGQPTAITELDDTQKETEHLAPHFLPDGRHYLFLALSDESGIYVGSIDSKERTRLLAADSRPLYAAPGYLLFNRGSTVFAQPFDAETRDLSGEAVRVADGVPLWVGGAGVTSPSLARTASYAVSQAGVLAYRTGGAAANATGGPDEQRSIFWVDRTGMRTGPVGTTGMYAGLDLSPDGKRFAVHRHEGAGGDSWLFDLAQGRMQRLTFDTTQDNSSPLWSPDGTRIAFASVRGNRSGLYVKSADGTGSEELILESESLKAPMSWSPDGKLLVYWQTGAGGSDIWYTSLSDKKPIPLLQSQFNEVFPQVSPDGKWLAYQSNETSRAEIYIKPFPEGPGKWQVSTDGGNFPRWSGDGKELYFVLAPTMWAAEIRISGSAPEPGVPQSLFTLGGAPNTNFSTHASYHRFAVSRDGQRFLLSQASGGATTSGGLADAVAAVADGGTGSQAIGISPNGVTVVVNWPQMLKGK